MNNYISTFLPQQESIAMQCIIIDKDINVSLDFQASLVIRERLRNWTDEREDSLARCVPDNALAVQSSDMEH